MCVTTPERPMGFSSIAELRDDPSSTAPSSDTTLALLHEDRLVDQAHRVADLWLSRCRHREVLAAALPRPDLSSPGHGMGPDTTLAAAGVCTPDVSGEVDAERRPLLLPTVRVRALVGCVAGQDTVAAAIGVTFDVDPGCRLELLPPTLTEISAVTILGNLVSNAFDAVRGLGPRHRRRVAVLITDVEHRLLLRVTDGGGGTGGLSTEALRQTGYSTKNGHSGLGLAIVDELAREAGGLLTLTSSRAGTVAEVTVPYV